jgi:zinc protease
MVNNTARILSTLALLVAAHAAFAILPIEHWQTKRGAHVYFVENHDLPILDVSVDFPAGAGFDTPDKSGAANMTANMLRLGAGGMDEDEIARKLADVGAQFAGRFDSDRAGAGLRTARFPAATSAALRWKFSHACSRIRNSRRRCSSARKFASSRC